MCELGQEMIFAALAVAYFWLQAIWCRRTGVHQRRHISGDLNKFTPSSLSSLSLQTISLTLICTLPDHPEGNRRGLHRRGAGWNHGRGRFKPRHHWRLSNWSYCGSVLQIPTRAGLSKITSTPYSISLLLFINNFSDAGVRALSVFRENETKKENSRDFLIRFFSPDWHRLLWHNRFWRVCQDYVLIWEINNECVI